MLIFRFYIPQALHQHSLYSLCCKLQAAECDNDAKDADGVLRDATEGAEEGSARDVSACTSDAAAGDLSAGTKCEPTDGAVEPNAKRARRGIKAVQPSHLDATSSSLNPGSVLSVEQLAASKEERTEGTPTCNLETQIE